jgi:galactose mutarotase-like enzyme
MNYTIENEALRVEIADRGAEIMSIVGKKTGFEYLWQGDATYWASRATVLFPICGRLTDGKYTYEGKEYEMVLHGFSKLQTHRVVEQKADAITFELSATEETRAIYPFDFIFRVTYTLDGATVRTTLAVENAGKGDLPFSIGGHPGFNVPFVTGESFDDYYMEFKCAKPTEKLIMSPTCYYTGKNEPFALRDGRFLDLKHSLFDNDAIFLEGMCNTVSLKSKKNDRAVTVHFEDMTHLGFWHKPKTEAPYVCIEPWHGVPAYDGKIDDFATKNEMMHLPAGKSYSTYFDISITE